MTFQEKKKREREEDEEGEKEFPDRHKGRHRGEHQSLNHRGEQNQTLTPCNHCNKNHPPPCNLLNNHPDCNPDASIPFAESEKGKLWLAKGHSSVSTQHTLDGSMWNNPNFNYRHQYGNNGHNRPVYHYNNNNRHNSHRGGHDNRHHNRRGRY